MMVDMREVRSLRLISGRHALVTTLAKTSTSTFLAPPRKRAREAALAVAPEVIDEHDSRSVDFRLRLFRYAESALDIAGALGPAQPDLRRRLLQPHQGLSGEVNYAGLRHRW